MFSKKICIRNKNSRPELVEIFRHDPNEPHPDFPEAKRHGCWTFKIGNRRLYMTTEEANEWIKERT